MAERSGQSHANSTVGTFSWVGLRGKPFAALVVFGGLVYSALALLVLAAPIALAGGLLAGGGFLLILFLFIALFLVAGVFSLREKRWAYVLGSAVAIILIILFIPEISSSLSNPASSLFWVSISVLPALFLAVLFSILSFRYAKGGLRQKRYLASPHSNGGLLALAVVGFVIGSIVSGAIGAGVITRLIATAGETADIQIVANAPSAAVPFDPPSLTVSVGDTVTWINADTMGHTVTSDTGLFDSGNLGPGDRWSHTFTQAGTYPYYCTPHPQMTGTIVVT